MSERAHTGDELAVVCHQIGREPREPWRVAVRCRYGYPSVIASPARLTDGTPFPTHLWLTCPWVAEGAARIESAGGTAAWSARLAEEPDLAEAVLSIDAEFRHVRNAASDGDDPCESVGIGGQRDPLGVKCLHVHAALSLAGLDDPIGRAVLEDTGDACPDARCARFVPKEETR